MAIMRWQPFAEMESLQRDMNRLFDSLVPREATTMQQMAFMPLAEMEETDDAIRLKVEIPGMKAEDLDVQVTKEAVMIAGERKSESKTKTNGMTRSEFRYGKFSRTIPLPTRIENTGVKGDYKDGILVLELPKQQDQKDRVTKVNISSSAEKTISESSSSSS